MSIHHHACMTLFVFKHDSMETSASSSLLLPHLLHQPNLPQEHGWPQLFADIPPCVLHPEAAILLVQHLRHVLQGHYYSQLPENHRIHAWSPKSMLHRQSPPILHTVPGVLPCLQQIISGWSVLQPNARLLHHRLLPEHFLVRWALHQHLRFFIVRGAGTSFFPMKLFT